ncbi:hypothetical protein BDK51DRAFT_52813 [Blyttiomyces helicus]|uniref:Uncharacterized protein n=1 Tax=Blyttiomyces helicus TaxID=388810 RepID=A0A4P9WLB0_9FUNG|nr:hypothetical protein BDK51DRAFT_52813 [Blyttiomyces helicus]|eukprot:RKO91426.1 hypothetical protein BDK51DRAFT_52813 [Blyttiomyces helicus]
MTPEGARARGALAKTYCGKRSLQSRMWRGRGRLDREAESGHVVGQIGRGPIERGACISARGLPRRTPQNVHEMRPGFMRIVERQPMGMNYLGFRLNLLHRALPDTILPWNQKSRRDRTTQRPAACLALRRHLPETILPTINPPSAMGANCKSFLRGETKKPETSGKARTSTPRAQAHRLSNGLSKAGEETPPGPLAWMTLIHRRQTLSHYFWMVQCPSHRQNTRVAAARSGSSDWFSFPSLVCLRRCKQSRAPSFIRRQRTSNNLLPAKDLTKSERRSAFSSPSSCSRNR